MIRFLLIAAALIGSAQAQQPASLSAADAKAKVAADPGCERSEYPNLEMTLFFCERDLVVWYFTTPNAKSPPGYIRRATVVRNGATYIDTNGHYDGTDAQQRDFDEWTARIVASLPR